MRRVLESRGLVLILLVAWFFICAMVASVIYEIIDCKQDTTKPETIIAQEEIVRIVEQDTFDEEYQTMMEDLLAIENQIKITQLQLETIQLQLDEYRISFTNEELEHLLMLVQHESGGESYDCQLWVASVIVNRVEDERYPDTLWEVIYDTSPVRQFTPTAKGLYKEPSESVRKAVGEALKQDYAQGCWMFNNASLTDNDVQSWFDGYELICTIDQVDFRR